METKSLLFQYKMIIVHLWIILQRQTRTLSSTYFYFNDNDFIHLHLFIRN